MTRTFILSILLGVSVGAVAAYLGSLMISRRMGLVGDALGHVALPGMGIALRLGIDPSIGAFAFVGVGVILIWRLSGKVSLSIETLVGIVFVTSVALGFLIVPEPELLESLFGNISKPSIEVAIPSILISIALFYLIKRIYPKLMLLNISEDLAAVQGVRSKKYNFIFLLAIAIVVSLGIRATGSLLVGALVIVPPAAARLVSGDLRRYGALSALFGASSSLLGIAVSQFTGFPPGPSIVLVSTLFFSAAFLCGKVEGRG